MYNLIVVLVFFISSPMIMAEEKQLGSYDSSQDSDSISILQSITNWLQSSSEDKTTAPSTLEQTKPLETGELSQYSNDSSSILDMLKGFGDSAGNGDGFSMMSSLGDSVMHTIGNLSDDFFANPIIKEIQLQLNKIIPSASFLNMNCDEQQSNC